MKEIIERIKLEAPPFFKRLQKIGGWFMGLSATFWGTAKLIPDLHIPQWITTGLTYTALAGVILSVVSTFPVADKDALEKKLDK